MLPKKYKSKDKKKASKELYKQKKSPDNNAASSVEAKLSALPGFSPLFSQPSISSYKQIKLTIKI